jgi:hypothetical protein
MTNVKCTPIKKGEEYREDAQEKHAFKCITCLNACKLHNVVSHTKLTYLQKQAKTNGPASLIIFF